MLIGKENGRKERMESAGVAERTVAVINMCFDNTIIMLLETIKFLAFLLSFVVVQQVLKIMRCQKDKEIKV